MPITLLDILLLGVMLISGLLAMIRGFMREILSITAWAAAAVATLLAYPRLLPLAKANISSDIVATGAVIGGVFLVTLLIVSIITVRDLRHDPRQPDRRARPHARLPVRARPRPDHRGGGVPVLRLARAGRKQPDGVTNAKSLECSTRPANGCRPCCRRTWIIPVEVVQETAEGRRGHAPPMPRLASDPICNSPDVTGSVRSIRLPAVGPHRHAPVDRRDER